MTSNTVKSLVTDLAKYVVLLSFSFVAPSYGSQTVNSGIDCATLLDPIKIERLNGDFVKIDGTAVTGDFIYPLDMVLHDLGLDQYELAKMRGKSVLSVAEGISGLLPHLIDQGAHARGLDLWYGVEADLPLNYSGELMREYVRDYGRYLIRGDARRIPMNSESVDLVLSHMLTNNVEPEKQKEILREALRVTKPGGEIRLFCFDDDDKALITEYLKNNYQDGISFRFEWKSWDIKFNGQTIKHSSNLLVINKTRGPSNPFEPIRNRLHR